MKKAAETGRRITASFLVAALAAGLSFSAYATSETREKIKQKEQEREQTQGQLNETKENISGLQGELNTLQGKLNNLNNQLSDVSDRLAVLEEQIREKEQEITETQAALEEARENADSQYEAMKSRIQYAYERDDYALLEGMLGMDSISDMLNYYDYVAAISEYDEQKLKEFRAIRDQIDENEKKLQKEHAELADYKVQVEAEQAKVSGYISSTSSDIAENAGELSNAQAEAEAYEKRLKEQDADLAALKKKLAEEQAMSRLASQSAKRDISEVSFAEDDRYLLANLIYCEAGGEPYAGQLAVGAVVVNRVLSSVYPDTVTGVIYQNRQFSPVASGRLAIALAENRATPACYQAADEAMSGVTNVGNCVYFRTPIEGLTGISIGGHIFY
ncbi:MAG: cell wall hydrolase [Lachnospiraceae bacterium]|jgi:spore germination cell wall hydrolase CwlJ-like protein|nr:cell wall hydrolase [Lachnospiraceae bacterium]